MFVSGLPESVTEQEVRERFRDVGPQPCFHGVEAHSSNSVEKFARSSLSTKARCMRPWNSWTGWVQRSAAVVIADMVVVVERSRGSDQGQEEDP